MVYILAGEGREYMAEKGGTNDHVGTWKSRGLLYLSPNNVVIFEPYGDCASHPLKALIADRKWSHLKEMLNFKNVHRSRIDHSDWTTFRVEVLDIEIAESAQLLLVDAIDLARAADFEISENVFVALAARNLSENIEVQDSANTPSLSTRLMEALNVDRSMLPSIRGSLANVRLIGRNLAKHDLSYYNFSRAQLTFCDLRGADLHYTDFNCADLRFANLCGVHFLNTNLQDANLEGASIDIDSTSSAHLLGTPRFSRKYWPSLEDALKFFVSDATGNQDLLEQVIRDAIKDLGFQDLSFFTLEGVLADRDLQIVIDRNEVCSRRQFLGSQHRDFVPMLAVGMVVSTRPKEPPDLAFPLEIRAIQSEEIYRLWKSREDWGSESNSRRIVYQPPGKSDVQEINWCINGVDLTITHPHRMTIPSFF